LILIHILGYKGLSNQEVVAPLGPTLLRDIKMNLLKISNNFPLILASKSPRRKALLDQVRLPYQVSPSRIKEEAPGLTAQEATLMLAFKKAMDVAKREGNKWILGADTMVLIDGQVLGKPEALYEARKMLERLNGKVHQVITGFCLISPAREVAHQEAVTTQVQFKELSANEIESYINTGEPLGKAGGYAIQGIGAFMVESISGSYTNVVGLPLCSLIKALIAVGAIDSFPL